MKTPTNAELRDFLLRHMPAEQAAEMEDAFILEDDVAERLRGVEFDLIDGRVMSSQTIIVEQGNRAAIGKQFCQSALGVAPIR